MSQVWRVPLLRIGASCRARRSAVGPRGRRRAAAPAYAGAEFLGGSGGGRDAGHEPEPPAEGFYYRYWEHDDNFHNAPAHYGYRDERYKIIYFYNDGLGLAGTGPFTCHGEWELYDLAVDPDELHNVADDPGYGEVRAQLEVALWRAQTAVGDVPHPSQLLPVSIGTQRLRRSAVRS